MSTSPRTGVTLVELLVALLLLGMMATVVGIAVPRAEPPSTADEISHAISNARRAAIDSGRSVTINLSVHGTLHAATALPDGSIVADTGLGVERLTGRARQPAQGPSGAS
jgi:prepilin-type N-terminal cleavage/methylation domain-containing protein